ncbi:unnamed protein product, partial [Bubo scandiacus]
IAKEHNLAVLCKSNIHQDLTQTTASKYLPAYKSLNESGCTKNNLLVYFTKKQRNYLCYLQFYFFVSCGLSNEAVLELCECSHQKCSIQLSIITAENCKILKISCSDYLRVKEEVAKREGVAKEELIQNCSCYQGRPQLYILQLAPHFTMETVSCKPWLQRVVFLGGQCWG